MRTLNGPMLKKLIARKMVLSDEDGNFILPETILNAQKLSDTQPEIVVEAPVVQEKESDISLLLKSNTEQIAKIVEIEKSLLDVVKEISKPKPKKNWNCLVSRDDKGIIKTINVKEM